MPTCACPILEVVPVNVGGAFTTPIALSATHCLPAQLERNPASMAASASAAASSATAVWTVQTGRTSWTVSFQPKTLSHEDVTSDPEVNFIYHPDLAFLVTFDLNTFIILDS